jgi:hypothetical protein
MPDGVSRIVPPSISLNRSGDTTRERKKGGETAPRDRKSRGESPPTRNGRARVEDDVPSDKNKGKILDITI